MKGTLARIPTLLVGATAIACQSGTQPPAGGLVCPVLPAAAAAGAVMTRAPAGAVPDASRNTISGATYGATLATVANAGGRTLSSALAGVAGHRIATFGNLRIDAPGSGHPLREGA